MKTLIVTASSKSKRDMTDILYQYSESTFYNSIKPEYKKSLLNARQELIGDIGLENGPDLEKTRIHESQEDYLPAFIRYSGRTFSKIDNQAWNHMVENPDNFDCIILSALYGIIRYNEPIRNYPIKQADKIPQKSTIKSFWKTLGASDWVFDYVKRNKIDNVKFVLSTSYSEIVQRDSLIDRLRDELGIIAEDKQFKAEGRKSMLLRGQYINDLLLDN
ncbi:MAG: peroxide stress protein YaaA [Candidatus Heimdallarchaeota archaeon]|nr:peroxide stress protein YaaA [Candidatus Heimdallarchaeota archaeon]